MYTSERTIFKQPNLHYIILQVFFQGAEKLFKIIRVAKIIFLLFPWFLWNFAKNWVFLGKPQNLIRRDYNEINNNSIMMHIGSFWCCYNKSPFISLCKKPLKLSLNGAVVRTRIKITVYNTSCPAWAFRVTLWIAWKHWLSCTNNRKNHQNKTNNRETIKPDTWEGLKFYF